MSEQEFLTRTGYEKLEQELKYLRTVRRQEVAQRLHQALEEGDILENAELEDARNEQAFLEGRILTVENLLRNATIIEENGPREMVGIGSHVTIKESDEPPETYHIVGSAEADPTQGQRPRWSTRVQNRGYQVNNREPRAIPRDMVPTQNPVG
jgi:transcription elongation factor GreA